MIPDGGVLARLDTGTANLVQRAVYDEIATDFTALKRSVSPQSTLFIYSDGITESTDEAGNEFDVNPLVETLLRSRDLNPCEMVEMVHRTIVGYDHGAKLSDDRTMLALRWSPKGILNHAAL